MKEISEAWGIDPFTLRDVARDAEALENALANGFVATERVRFLALLNRENEALREGYRLLDASPDSEDLLLVLAMVLQRQYRWHEAAVLQEEALQLASTRSEEANVRHHIGCRLFDEARYRDATAEFQWASDLYRAAGQHQLTERSKQAMRRSSQMQAHAKLGD